MRQLDAPKYLRIERDLRSMIGAGTLRVGTRLASEAALGARYGVSRMTVRHALDRLEAAGLVVRRQGVGTFVAHDKVERLASRLLGFQEDAIAHGLETATTVLDHALGPAGDDARALAAEPDDVVLRVRRLRFAAGDPIGLNTVVVAPPFVDALRDLDYVASWYDGVAAALGVQVAEADQTIEAVASDRDLSRSLDVAAGAPLLRVTRITYLRDGRLVGLTRTLYRGDRYYLSLTVRRDDPAAEP